MQLMKKPWFTIATLFVMTVVTHADEDPPMNRVQFIGTHNSYHIAPSPKIQSLIESFAKGEGDAINVTQRPLTEQLGKLGLRQLELDLFADPKGGLYSDPLGARLVAEVDKNPDPYWKEPGLKILHSPDFDFRTTVPTFRKALRELVAWSSANPKHEPVMVLLELKEQSFSPRIRPIPFDDAQLRSVEEEIRAEMPENMIFTPDRLRGDASTLRQAITTRGWPKLSEAAGKFLFCMDNEGSIRDRYLALSPDKDLHGRIMLVSVPPEHPAAAWMKRNDPVGGFEEIKKLVAAGFMVRTRADADLMEIKAKDTTRLKKAVDSGAQWISTDAPEELPNFPGYQVRWGEGRVWQLLRSGDTPSAR
jgi:hypothetical protein